MTNIFKARQNRGRFLVEWFVRGLKGSFWELGICSETRIVGESWRADKLRGNWKFGSVIIGRQLRNCSMEIFGSPRVPSGWYMGSIEIFGSPRVPSGRYMGSIEIFGSPRVPSGRYMGSLEMNEYPASHREATWVASK